jgi:YgiT-type zinc finger domain-containing protein
MQAMTENPKKAKCNFCGSEQYEERRIEYLYSYKGQYLLVPDTPVEVCVNCGMIYYDAAILKEIERRFFAIQQNTEKPDRYIQMPSATYA